MPRRRSQGGRTRCTRLADLVNVLDPKLVAAAFGMDPEVVMIYLTDRVDPGRETDLPHATAIGCPACCSSVEVADPKADSTGQG